MDERPLTPAEALVRLFLTNADRAANDALVEQLKQRIRAVTQLPEDP